jgi:hypothetical protein
MASRRVRMEHADQCELQLKRRSTHFPIKLNNATIKEKRTKAKDSNQYFATWEPEPHQWYDFFEKKGCRPYC